VCGQSFALQSLAPFSWRTPIQRVSRFKERERERERVDIVSRSILESVPSLRLSTCIPKHHWGIRAGGGGAVARAGYHRSTPLERDHYDSGSWIWPGYLEQDKRCHLEMSDNMLTLLNFSAPRVVRGNANQSSFCEDFLLCSMQISRLPWRGLSGYLLGSV